MLQLFQRMVPAGKPFRISLRLKLAFPVLILSILMLGILVQTTFRTVRAVAVEHNESRLRAVAEVFAETVKVPLILNNQQVLLANIEWMAKRPDVLEVRVEDSKGVIIGGENASNLSLPDPMVDANFMGVRRIRSDTYAVAVPIKAHSRQLGRVLILFGKQGVEAELRAIFQERLFLGLVIAFVLALVAATISWLATRPISDLQKTTRKILSGDLSARAKTTSFDEIQDLGEAFNEMVTRLARSLDKLRARTEALEESEEKYRIFVDNTSDIMLTLTPEGQLVLLNKGMSGYSREEIMSRGLPLISELHAPESRQKFADMLEQVREGRREFINAQLTHLYRGTQNEIYYLTNISPVVDHEGELRWIQVVMRDITELRRIEVMKESLIRDVAHELKTPTAKFEMAVNWFEQELAKHHETEKYAQVIDILKKNTDRLMRTIMSIMDLSKLESGMAQLMAEEIDLNEVLRQVCQDMEPICQQKGLALEMLLFKNALPMKGDRDMLYRLFINLIGNAAKFTDAGKVTLKSELSGRMILVTVSDTGPGIEKEFLEKIFEKFVQKTAAALGIGVGLTISREIVTLHHGRIWAESEGLGKGASFKVEFHISLV